MKPLTAEELKNLSFMTIEPIPILRTRSDGYDLLTPPSMKDRYQQYIKEVSTGEFLAAARKSYEYHRDRRGV